jgi:hypothetical protein
VLPSKQARASPIIAHESFISNPSPHVLCVVKQAQALCPPSVEALRRRDSKIRNTMSDLRETYRRRTNFKFDPSTLWNDARRSIKKKIHKIGQSKHGEASGEEHMLNNYFAWLNTHFCRKSGRSLSNGTSRDVFTTKDH